MAVSPNLFGPDDDDDGAPFAEINVTPLVDVMLVLLVIFMMAAPLIAQGVPIDLPKSDGARLGQPTKPIIVSLTRDGGLYLRSEPVALADLPGRLRALRTEVGDSNVYVRADRGIAYGQVMDLIGRLGTGGFSHVSLLSQPGTAADIK